MIPLNWFFVFYSGSALIGITLLWFYYDRRDKKLFEERRRQRAFHCVRCGEIYGVRKSDVSEGEDCPSCGHKNFELRF